MSLGRPRARARAAPRRHRDRRSTRSPTIGDVHAGRRGLGQARTEPRAGAARRARRAGRAGVRQPRRRRRSGTGGYDLAARHLQAGIDLLQRARPGARPPLPARLTRAPRARSGPTGPRQPNPPRPSSASPGRRSHRASARSSCSALVRARRGDPEHWAPLDEAWALAEPTGELPRIGQVAAARAEAAWLDGDHDAVAAATEGVARARLANGVGACSPGSSPTGTGAPGRARRSRPAPPSRTSLQLAGEWARAADALARARLPVRGRARTRRRGRGGGAAARARRAAAARGTSGGGDRRPATPRARRARPAARARDP